jgi:transposase-like protein
VLYRAVDRVGRTVDFRLSARCDVAAAKAFFRKAIQNHQRPPQTITLDGYAASHRAVRELKADGSLPPDTKQRSSRYLNDLIEQDHRSVKQHIAVMLGFKQFRHAAITIAGSARSMKVALCIRDAACSCCRFAPEPSRGHRGAESRQGADRPA